MTNRNQNNSTDYVHPQESNLFNLHTAMQYNNEGQPVLRTHVDGISLAGDVIVDKVKLWDGTNNLIFDLPSNDGETAPWSLPTENHNMVFNGSTWDRMRGNIADGVLVKLSNGNIAVTGTFWQATQPVSGTVTIQDGGGSITVDGNVSATITDVISVLVNEDTGSLYAFNNHASAANRGWTMDNTMRPVVSFQNGSTNITDIIKILEYEIGNNNANQSTIVYEWYEGPLTISGAAIPNWTTFGVHSKYRVYQDVYSSNTGNTFTVPAGTYLRHSGIIIGKNTSGDEGPASLHGGDSPNMLTLCMRRVDNATKLDVWFAFTVRELE